MADLTGKQIERFCDALVAAFDRGELEQLTRIDLEENLEAIAGSGKLGVVAYELVTWAQRTGRVGDLLTAAQSRRPNNAAFALLAQELGAEPAANPSAPPSTPDGVHVDKIEAVNAAIGGAQIIDQRGANFYIGGTKINTGGDANVGGTVLAPELHTVDFASLPKETSLELDKRPWRRLWKWFVDGATVVGAVVGTISVLILFSDWLHGVYGPISCIPDDRFWGGITAISTVLLVGIGLLYRLYASKWRKILAVSLAISLAFVALFGLVRSLQAGTNLPVFPTGRITIAVSNFGEGGKYSVDGGRQRVQGNLVCNSAVGGEFTNQLLIQLRQTIENAEPAFDDVDVVWLDRHIHSQDEAIEAAKAMNATILTWGWFLSNDNDSFYPHFVVLDPDEALEPARLLTSLTSAPHTAGQVGVTQTRIEILTNFIFGVVSMQSDRTQMAQQYFQRSLDKTLQEGEAQNLLPLLYYYSGRIDNELGHAEQAEAKFDAGLEQNREYAILYLNKGNILYQRARQVMEDPSTAFDFLDQAAQLFQRAIDSLEKETPQFVDGKAHANLGHVALTQGQIAGDRPDLFLAALREYETAETLLREAQAPSCILGQVEISKAFVYEEQQEIASARAIYEGMFDEYGACIGLIKIAGERLAVLSREN